MVRSFSPRWEIALLVLCALLMVSCQPSTADAPLAATPSTGTAEPEYHEAVFGPGAFNLPVPTVGLAGLSSYRETLTSTFEGTQAGQPAKWSRTYVMVASGQPPARQVIVETAGSTGATVLALELDGALFERAGDEACAVSFAEEGSSLSDKWEPARFLPGVIGAEEAGAETVNDVASTHYTFDQRAIGGAESAKSIGEMWVAADGGYLVRYVLTSTGGASYFGEGTDGTATWEYQLTDINQPLTVEVPDECPAGLVDAPLLTDATDVVRDPGLLTYSTAVSVADVSAFYQQQLPALGWQPPSELDGDEDSVWLQFTRADERLSVIVTPDQGATSVLLILER